MPRRRGLPTRESKLIESPDGMAQIAKGEQVDDCVACAIPRPRLFTEPAALYPEDDWGYQCILKLTREAVDTGNCTTLSGLYLQIDKCTQAHRSTPKRNIYTCLEFATDVMKNILTMHVHSGVNTALEDWRTSVFGQWKGVYVCHVFFCYSYRYIGETPGECWPMAKEEECGQEIFYSVFLWSQFIIRTIIHHSFSIVESVDRIIFELYLCYSEQNINVHIFSSL